jgi:Spy/CpxP family protein refolding chaperone
MLTESQWAKLQNMRQDQRKELKQLIDEDSGRATK